MNKTAALHTGAPMTMAVRASPTKSWGRMGRRIPCKGLHHLRRNKFCASVEGHAQPLYRLVRLESDETKKLEKAVSTRIDPKSFVNGARHVIKTSSLINYDHTNLSEIKVSPARRRKPGFFRFRSHLILIHRLQHVSGLSPRPQSVTCQPAKRKKTVHESRSAGQLRVKFFQIRKSLSVRKRWIFKIGALRQCTPLVD